MSIFDCFQHIGDVGCTDIPEGIGSFWKGLKKLTEYVPEDIPTGDYSEPAESLEDAENLLKSQALIKKSYRKKKSIAKQRRQNGTLGRLK